MSNSEEQKSYTQILKATSIFGGVQFFNILIAIIRSKAIAILLGPAGMGVAGLLTSTTGLISSLTNFGLGTSAVRNIAEAHSSNDTERIAKTIAVLRKLVWFTGSLGAILTLLLSQFLSEITFGNKDYTWSFVLLSITLLVNQLASGQNVILQGTRHLKYLALANILGSASTIFVALPLYYYYGQKGIVPATILMSLMGLVIANNFSSKVKFKKVEVGFFQTIQQGKEMMKLGFMLSLSALVSTFVSYLINIYISNSGNVADVGLYNAGFQIVGTYVGLIFSAMGTDYFPRLSGMGNDNVASNQLVNQQSEVAILIIGPIVLFFIVFINWGLLILYSDKFIAINEMVRWAALGTIFKAVSWPIGFIFLAKGDSRTFFWSELLSNFYVLVFNILGYSYFGLEGLGISYVFSYILFLIQVYFIAKVKYKFVFETSVLRIFFVQITLGLICFLIIKNVKEPYNYILSLVFLIVSIVYSVRVMNNFLKLRQIVNKLGRLLRR
jgi:O-antigen/teichoic acid export membrane protein